MLFNLANNAIEGVLPSFSNVEFVYISLNGLFKKIYKILIIFANGF